MEDNIKNFDRNVERLMNEHEVAPPFGMWNRISAELDALPVAAGTAPNALLPKRAIAGFIAGAVIIGASLIAGYLVSSSLNKEETKAPVQSIAPLASPVATPVTVSPVPVKVVENEQPAIIPHHKALHASLISAVSTNAGPVEAKTNESSVAPVQAPVSASVTNSNCDVPAAIEPVSQDLKENQTYYFPPIDVNTPEKSNRTNAVAIAKAHELDAKPYDEDKPKVSISKIKFHPKRRGSWENPRINRVK